MEIIIKGNAFFLENGFASFGDCTCDCSSFCIDCTLGF